MNKYQAKIKDRKFGNWKNGQRVFPIHQNAAFLSTQHRVVNKRTVKKGNLEVSGPKTERRIIFNLWEEPFKNCHF